jgi:hypothetical protein
VWELSTSWFLGYLVDGKKENSLTLDVEEIRALELGFCKEDVIGKEIHVKFLCLLDLVKTKY